jgi:hypothetical protein
MERRKNLHCRDLFREQGETWDGSTAQDKINAISGQNQQKQRTLLVEHEVRAES